MTFQAISTSHSSHFRSKRRRKFGPATSTFHHPTQLRCSSDRHIVAASEGKRSSVSTYKSTNDLLLRSEKQKRKDWIHFIGVGGCGLSALAMLALKQGFEVSGSDIAWSDFMDRLLEAGAQLYVGHSVSNILNKNGDLPDAIVVSSAIPVDNVEILHARAMGIPVYKRGAWLGSTTAQYNLIAVSGTHGKSTTASMLAYVLNSMGDDLTAIVGAHVPQFADGNVLWGHSPNFVLEADEYDDCFIQLSPAIAVITNVEWEHVDIFHDEEAVKNSFRKFLKKIRVGGHLILCGDSEGAYSLLSHTSIGTVPVPSERSSQLLDAGYRVTTYGTSTLNDWQASSICPNPRGGTDYELYHMGCLVAAVSLQLAGVHNVLNSLAVIATVSALINDQLPTKKLINCVRLHLNNFIGVSRRFEMIGYINRCHIFDDYAHHPTEVRAVIQAARQKFPLKALLVIFQPHTFSRLATFMKSFSTAFGDADRVVVTEVYASREMNNCGVSGRDLAISITGPPTSYIPSVSDVVDRLAVEISSNPDQELVVLTLGAGDVTHIGPKLLEKLQQI